MGASSVGHCFVSVVEAAANQCASYPVTAAVGGGVVSFACAGVASDGSSLSLLRTGTDGVTTASTLAVSFAECDENQASADALAMWGLGLTACAGVWAVKNFVYKLVANQ